MPCEAQRAKQGASVVGPGYAWHSHPLPGVVWVKATG